MTSDLDNLKENVDKAMQERNALKGTVEPQKDDFNAAYEKTSQDSFVLSGMFLGFGLILTMIFAHLVKSGNEPESLVRVFGMMLIVISAVFLMIAGYSEKQIAPVFGLLGTVAGYLLGRSSVKKGGHLD
ncbi:hypothetical protein [Marinobacter alexandrii]|uniref:hypothetical protein n=1 Tax=Marinobacter alexandrii TaxID=2570351 RepID=UPI00110999DA|nr:hypothetical protein [Marinobacter alexandrii]